MKSLLLKLLLILVGVFFAFLTCEAAIRLYPLISTEKNVHLDRPEFYYKYSGTRSLKNPPYSVQKPENTFRIIVIGDSFTFPHMIQLDDAYTSRLSRMLNLNLSGKKRVEVLNFGLSGANSLVELLQTKKALNFSPDFILLEITINDIQGGNFQRSLPKLKKKYAFGKLEISREKTPLLYYFRSLAYLAQRIQNERSHKAFVRYNLDLYQNKTRWNGMKGAILAMKNRCEAQEVAFAAFLMPFFHFELDDNYPFLPIHKKIMHFLKHNKIPSIDLYEAFSAIPVVRLQVMPGKDSHPNEIAHRIIAEQLYLWLESKELIPKSARIKKKMPTRFHRE